VRGSAGAVAAGREEQLRREEAADELIRRVSALCVRWLLLLAHAVGGACHRRATEEGPALRQVTEWMHEWGADMTLTLTTMTEFNTEQSASSSAVVHPLLGARCPQVPAERLSPCTSQSLQDWAGRVVAESGADAAGRKQLEGILHDMSEFSRGYATG
jgi:hypothetical protein